MKRYCELENAVVAALQSGTLSAELSVHIENCPICSEVVFVMESLRVDAAAAPVGRMPDSAWIWQRAQSFAREKAIEKATQPIRIVMTVSIVTAVFAIPWMFSLLSKLTLKMPDFGLSHFSMLDRQQPAALTNGLLLCLTATLICTALSSWYMLR